MITCAQPRKKAQRSYDDAHKRSMPLPHPSVPLDPNHAEYDGRVLRLRISGEELEARDERRRLVTHIVVLPGVTAIHDFWGLCREEDMYYPGDSKSSSWGGGACSDCTSLRSVEFPDGLLSIGSFAFENCVALSSIILPTGLTTISQRAFLDCSSLSSVKFPASLTTIDSNAFQRCTSLSSIELPRGLRSVDHGSFFGCTALAVVRLPEGLVRVGSGSFGRCTSLTSINLPDSVVDICPSAFVRCTILEQLSLETGVSVVNFIRSRRSSVRSRYCVLACLEKLTAKLNAGEEYHSPEVASEEGGVEEGGAVRILRGVLAFDIITSADVWRHILEFL